MSVRIRPLSPLVLLALACQTVQPTPPPVIHVSVVPASGTIEAGDTTRLVATVTSDGKPVAGRAVSWSSSTPEIASISPSGLVTGLVAGGPVTISATADGATGSAQVTVVPAAVATVSLVPGDTILAIGEEYALVATVRDGRGGILDRRLTWSSDNPAVATVDTLGRVTAMGVGGPASVTARAEGVSGQARVSVRDEPVVAVRIQSPSSELNAGDSVQLTAETVGRAGQALSGRPVVWSSLTPSLAAVDPGGRVRGIGAGLARILAASQDGAADTLELPIRGLRHRWTFSETGGPGTQFVDEVGGETARLVGVGTADGLAQGGQVTLAGGPKATADYVALPSGLLRQSRNATIEIWATVRSLKPWSRVFDFGSGPGNSLFAAWSQGVDPATDRVAFALGGNETRIDQALAPFVLDLQHHIVVRVADGAGAGGQTRVSVFLNGVRRGSFDTPHRLDQLDDRDLWLGRSHHGDDGAHASYDEVRLHDRVYPDADIAAFFVAGPARPPVVALEIGRPVGMRDTVRGTPVTFPLTAVGRDANGNRFPIRAGWSSAQPAVAQIDTNGLVTTAAAGSVAITARVGAMSAVAVLEVVREARPPIDPFLANPIANAVWEVPVAVIAFFPTADGSNLDVRKSPDFWALGPMTLEALERRVLDMLRWRKMMVEQGSRFHGYRDAAARPSLGYRVVDYRIVYGISPPSPRFRWLGVPGDPRFPDYFKIFADYGLTSLVNNQGVREVWMVESSFDGGFPSYDPSLHDLADARAGFESNMSSPTTGDISNSFRWPDDLPVLNRTYVLYGVNFRRSQAEAVHNVGHQLEAMFGHVANRQDGNTGLFWKQFVGQDAAGNFITGRAGWTHMPPNTTGNYDYLNRTMVSSDIEDWRPSGGPTKPVNLDTWGTLTYPWPGGPPVGQREESQWYVYWMQNMPGLGNQIPHGSRWMTNWWSFVADWDLAITSGLGLHGPAVAAGVGASSRAAGLAPAPFATPEPERNWPVHPPRRPDPPRSGRPGSM